MYSRRFPFYMYGRRMPVSIITRQSRILSCFGRRRYIIFPQSMHAAENASSSVICMTISSLHLLKSCQRGPLRTSMSLVASQQIKPEEPKVTIGPRVRGG
ncbi:hypothetical protein BJX66DRAFT_30854 [Aspergillus keveii]|uniref:Uncharacterized protein n=1 Tax=Aspergillus keveii TaxID=714993 RepID=A0ABR4FT69_9EURO